MKYTLIILFFLCDLCFGQSTDILWQRYQKGDFKFVLQQALQSRYKETVDMQLLMGRTLTDLGEFDKAAPYLRNVISARESAKHQKAWAEAYLGVCMFTAGKLDESRMLLSKCIVDNITSNCSKYASGRMSLFGFTERFQEFDTETSEHFVFHFERGADNSIDISTYISRREEAYEAISKFFGTKLDGKISYFSWRTTGSLQSGMGTSSGFARPEYRIIHATFSQTAGHEIAHLFVHSKRKSMLINEGLAVYLDQEHGDLYSIAKNLLKNGSMPKVNIQEMWNTAGSYDAKTYYTIAGAFVEELIKKAGKEKFLKLTEDQTIQNAEAIYDNTFLDLVNKFEKNMNSI